MDDRVKNAVETYRNTGFNCAQSVLKAFAPQFGMEGEAASRIACGLGSGMGRTGNMCGAVTGGLLVLGLKFGMTDPDSTDDKEKTYEEAAGLIARIEAIHGSVNCNDLMGVDIGTPEGMQEVQEKGLSEKICEKIVGDVALILEELLADG